MLRHTSKSFLQQYKPTLFKVGFFFSITFYYARLSPPFATHRDFFASPYIFIS